jgi:hypothetical protein
MVHNDAQAVRLQFGVGVVHHDRNRADARVEAMREVGAAQSLGRIRDQLNDLFTHAPADFRQWPQLRRHDPTRNVSRRPVNERLERSDLRECDSEHKSEDWPLSLAAARTLCVNRRATPGIGNARQAGRAAGSVPKRNGVGAVTGLSVFLTSLDAYRALNCMGVPDNMVCGLFRERAAQSGDLAHWL